MTAVSLLTADVAAAVLTCPVVAIAASTRRSVAQAVVAAAIWISVSIGLVAGAGLDLRSVLVAHLVLVSAALASAGIGRAMRAVLVDSLDAIALALCLSLGASIGLFAMGRFAAELPPAALNGMLAANPLVATMSAARIDIFHNDLLYRVSPVAHLLFDYPSWQVSTALFVIVASASFAIARWSPRRTLLRRAS
jgi:hypothetical protein